MKKVAVIIELENGQIKDANFGAITLARQNGCDVFAMVAGGKARSLKPELASLGVVKIIDISLGKTWEENPAVMAKAVVQVVETFGISVVMGLSTAKGKDLLPRIAAFLEAPLVMDCVAVDLDRNLVKTSQYSGKTMATLEVSGEICVFGIRPNIIEPVKEPGAGEIIQFDATGLVSEKFRVIRTGKSGGDAGVSLPEAEVIIAGGRGMKNPANFELLSRCAEKLNAAVGASRVAVDSGWVPYAMQVGQTGEKVSPKVYIACGISGSIQHFAGMKTSGMVIAVNTDENAAIMSNADYYAVADAMEVIPELTKLL